MQSAHRRWQQHHGVITHFYSPKRLITLVPSSSPILAQPPQNSQVLMSMMYQFYCFTIYTWHTVDFLSKETSQFGVYPKKTKHPSTRKSRLDWSRPWLRSSAANFDVDIPQQPRRRLKGGRLKTKETRQNTGRFNINDLWFDNVCWNSEWNWMF